MEVMAGHVQCSNEVAYESLGMDDGDMHVLRVGNITSHTTYYYYNGKRNNGHAVIKINGDLSRLVWLAAHPLRICILPFLLPRVPLAPMLPLVSLNPISQMYWTAEHRDLRSMALLIFSTS